MADSAFENSEDVPLREESSENEDVKAKAVFIPWEEWNLMKETQSQLYTITALSCPQSQDSRKHSGTVCARKKNKNGRLMKRSLYLVLELLAIEYGLKYFEEDTCGKHVKTVLDNTCAVSYLKKYGGSP